MAGRGDDSVSGKHYDPETLLAYALDQLPPATAARIAAHLAICPACANVAGNARQFALSLDRELSQSLDSARPAPNLSFDPIAKEWRKPPRRLSYRYRLTHFASGVALLPILLLMALAVTLLAPFENSLARRSLHLTSDYAGPPALVAVAFDGNVAVVRLDGPQTGILREVRHAGSPTDLGFSPDGRWLVFRRGGTLHVIEVSENGIHAKLDLRESAAWAWSPDGTTLAYTDGRGQLLTFNPASQRQSVLVPAVERAWGPPVWSPDGAQIAYAVDRSIWRVDLASGYRVELVRSPKSETPLLVPAAWPARDTLLVAWDAGSVQPGLAPLYRVDTGARRAVSLNVELLARGGRIAWPINPEGTALTVYDDRLVTLDLVSDRARAVPEMLRWPLAAEWAPGGAWLAAIVAGQPGGEGLFLYAPEEAQIVHLPLPPGAIEISPAWAGPEHIFVLRQATESATLELWLVSVTGIHEPQRVLANIPTPESGMVEWHWQDAIATVAVSVPPQSSR